MNSHNSYDLIVYNTLAPLPSRVRSQSLQPVWQFTTARSNYATASQCGFCLIIYLTVKENYNMSIDSRQAVDTAAVHFCEGELHSQDQKDITMHNNLAHMSKPRSPGDIKIYHDCRIFLLRHIDDDRSLTNMPYIDSHTPHKITKLTTEFVAVYWWKPQCKHACMLAHRKTRFEQTWSTVFTMLWSANRETYLNFATAIVRVI
jgi:hypothetical protein